MTQMPSQSRLILNLTLLALVSLATLGFAQESFAQETGNEPIDKELDKYWNVEQKVPTLQNPRFERKGGLEAALHFGVIPNDSFYLPKTLGARLGYFFTDTISVEVGFSYLLQSKSDLQTFLTAAPRGTKTVDLTQGAGKAPLMNWTGSADLAWAPFHGKLGIFATKLTNFDLGFVAGVGIINATIDNSLDGDVALENLPQAVKVAGHWGATLRFYVLRWLNVRLDYRQFAYKPAEKFLSPVELSLGVAFLTK